MQNRWSSDEECEFVVHGTPTSHNDVLAGGDEFAAAFESCVAHFELYDGLRLLLTFEIGDEKSISEPQEQIGTLQIGCARVPPAYNKYSKSVFYSKHWLK